MSEPFVAEIIMFAGTFAPRNWAYCNGELLATDQNEALFSLLGATYGGDGRTTFGLPDLRGRAPMHPGSGLGLSARTLGQKAGEERVSITDSLMPSHTHTMSGIAGAGTGDDPKGNRLAQGLYQTTAPDVSLDSQALANTGGSQSHENMQPWLAVNFIIALYGIYPSRH